MHRVTKSILISLWVLLLAGNANADHITGGEMYYTYSGLANGIHTYQVTLRLLMRCNSGRNFPNPIRISVFEKGTNARFTDLSIPLGNQTKISLDNTNPCISNPPFVCFDVAEYYFPVNVPASAAGYTIAAQVNFRISGMQNVEGGFGNIGATYTSDIPGNAAVPGGPENSSAKFTGSDLVVICANNSFSYSFKAEDVNNDQLRYSLCDAYQTGTSGGPNSNNNPPLSPPYPLVPYNNGFGGSAPLGLQVGISSGTGLITGVAPGPGVYVVTVCVDEIRDGIIIATQRKDIQINITGCTIAAATLPEEIQLCKSATQLTLSNQSVSSLINSYNWSIFTRGGSPLFVSTDPVISYNFADTGLYRVQLYTNAGNTCPDSASTLIRVYPGFNAAFTIEGTCFERATRFTDATTTIYGAVDKYRWDFGQPGIFNDTSTLKNPFYTYASIGNKQVSLIAANTNGCLDTLVKPWEISDRPLITLAFKDTLICRPDSLTLQASGTGDFSWAPGNEIIANANTATPMVSPLGSTTYYVTLNQEGCINTDSVRVRVTDRVLLQVMNDTTVCAGDPVQLRASGNGLQYIWAPDPFPGNAGVANPVVSIQTPAIFKITATVGSCSAIDSITVNAVPYPQVDAGPDRLICFNATTQLSGTTNGQQVQWSPATGISNPNTLVTAARPAGTIAYVLTATDNRGCPKPARDTVLITVLPAIQVKATVDTSAVIGQPLQLSASGGDRYEWVPGDGLSNPLAPNPIFNTSEPVENMTYKVLVYNAAGCYDSAWVSLRVFANGPTIYVPTAFTPNGDRLNETLKPTLAGMQRLNYFRVFNRYGELVYSTSRVNEGWDGMHKGQKMPSGLVVWMVSAVDFGGKEMQSKGSALLIR